ncbi:MAG: hypothetical protein ACI88A_003427 [Paraglaciecola sp.]|jgi:hypothetical protein
MKTYRFIIFSILFLSPTALALPENCLQLPERISACPHLIYKKAIVDVPILGIKANQMICICLSDLGSLRLQAHGKLAEIEQQVTLSRLAAKLQLSEQDLLALIRD